MGGLTGPAVETGNNVETGSFDEVKGRIYGEILALVIAADLLGGNERHATG